MTLSYEEGRGKQCLFRVKLPLTPTVDVKPSLVHSQTIIMLSDYSQCMA